MKKELLKGLSEDQISKIKSCKSTIEILEVAKQEGIELTEEQLEAVSGGCGTFTADEKCPKCGYNQLRRGCFGNEDITYYLTCTRCNYKWEEL